MPKLIDLAGMKFNRLTVIKRIPNGTKPQWLCVCECGAEKVIVGDHLRSGHTKSCGCAQLDEVRGRVRHGHNVNGKATKEYTSWSAMLGRCLDKNNASYKNYGGRGIKVCERWLVFDNFLQDMGLKLDMELTLDRINNDGDYEPNNCRWATRSEQVINQRPRKNKTSQFKGVHWDSKYNKWRAQGYKDGKRISLGRFDTEEEAFLATQRHSLHVA